MGAPKASSREEPNVSVSSKPPWPPGDSSSLSPSTPTPTAHYQPSSPPLPYSVQPHGQIKLKKLQGQLQEGAQNSELTLHIPLAEAQNFIKKKKSHGRHIKNALPLLFQLITVKRATPLPLCWTVHGPTSQVLELLNTEQHLLKVAVNLHSSPITKS